MTADESANPRNHPSAAQVNHSQTCELGFYTLAGHSGTPRDLIDECHAAEELGLGTAFISERFNTKDATALSGAAAAVSTSLGIATAATNHNTRHPLITATFAMTMHRLTEGRFALGLGRGFDALFDIMGLPHITMAQMADAIDLYRRLWRGEMIFAHDGPAGNYPMLCLDPSFDETIPVMLTAIGERTLEFAGSLADGVILHTFFSNQALERSVAAVHRDAEQAGRDPANVRIWSVLATVGDHLDEETRLKKLVGRLATYLQGYGDLMVSVNDWDPQVLVRFRADSVVGSIGGAIDAKATVEQLEHISTLLPQEWLQAAATGTAEECARGVLAQFDLGADGVILHGATPTELAPVVAAYRQIRPASRFDSQLANPGWAAS
ncbi:MAG: TIGR03857 family LLM class F420-dependent oxidoreductase [Microthrixaceae bacterium]